MFASTKAPPAPPVLAPCLWVPWLDLEGRRLECHSRDGSSLRDPGPPGSASYITKAITTQRSIDLMKMIRALLGLVTAVGLFAIIVAPASAEWKSLNGTSHGPSQLVEGTTAVFTVAEVESPELKCAKVPDEWKLQKKDASQGAVTTGGHLQLKSKWEECTVTVLGIKVPVQVSGCELELRQPPGVFTATGVVNGNCIVTVQTKPACVIEVSGQNGANQQLTEIKLLNKGTVQEDVVNVKGITSKIETTKKRCEELGAKPAKGTFKANVIMHELNAF